MTAVEIAGLTKILGASVVLEGITLSVEQGAVFGLLGPNGSGKSTLLRVLATLERPTRGRVLILGKDIDSRARQVRRTVGFVPDVPGIHRGLTVVEHLDVVALCYGFGRRERHAAVETMLQLLDLTAWQSMQEATLSRGLQKRLALAVALVHNPEVLLLDEPLAGLDAAGRKEMREVLQELRSMGKTIVMASHSFQDLNELCDAVGIVHNGHMVASGPLSTLIPQDTDKGRVVRMRVSDDVETARTVLMQASEASELKVGSDGLSLTFTVAGDRATIPGLLQRMVAAGVQVAEIAMENLAPDDALAQTLQEFVE